MHDDKLIDVATGVALELPPLYARSGKKWLSERYHVQPATNLVVARLAPRWSPRPALVGKAFGDTCGWKRLGTVDNVFNWPDGTRIFLELKCGIDLSACVWDAVKLATGVLGGNAESGYMLAAAPRDRWQSAARGTELFATARWETAGPAIRHAYRDWWRLWEKEGHIPGQVPSRFETIALGSFPFVVEGVHWDVRLARVVPGSRWIDWEPIALERD